MRLIGRVPKEDSEGGGETIHSQRALYEDPLIGVLSSTIYMRKVMGLYAQRYALVSCTY